MSNVLTIKLPPNKLDKKKLKEKATTKGFDNINAFLVSTILKLQK